MLSILSKKVSRTENVKKVVSERVSLKPLPAGKMDLLSALFQED